MKNNKTVKGLQSQLSLLEGEIESLKVAIKNKQRELELKHKTAKSLREQINILNHPQEPTVSEHALLRYLERSKGMDLDAVRNEILSKELLDIMGKMGCNLTWKTNGHEIVVKDNVVITVK